MKKFEAMANGVVTIGIPVMPEREHYIDQGLRSVINQNFSEPYEIIIAQHPGFTYPIKLESIPANISIKLITSGKSHTQKRNDILRQASGKYIIYIDDDAVPEPDWLQNMMQGALENDYDIFWGLAKPIYEKEFPESLNPFEMMIGGFHVDRKGKLRRTGLIGCNFGFKKGLKHKRGEFCEEFGRGTPLYGGEEVLFVAESLSAHMGLIEGAVVRHYIQENRINFSYILKNQYMNIQTRIIICKLQNKNTVVILRSIIKELLSQKLLSIYFFQNLELFIVKLTSFFVATLKARKHYQDM